MAGLVAAVLALTLGTQPGISAVLALAGIAFLIGSVEVLRDNTAETILPEVVDAQDLETANASRQSSENLTGQFIGPPLAEAMIAGSIGLPFGFHAVMLAGSALPMTLPVVRQRAGHKGAAFWMALCDGLRWLWGNVVLRRLGIVLGAYNFLYQMIWAIMALYAQDALHLDSVRYGVLMSALALGGLASGLIAPWLLTRIGVRRGLLLSILGFCISTSVLVFTDDPWLAGVALCGDAFTSMTWNVATVSYRQRHIPTIMLGRVNAVYRFLGSGPRPFGSLLGSALVAFAALWVRWPCICLLPPQPWVEF